MEGELPEEVTRFLSEHIRSVEQLEVLLLLQRTATRTWTADQIAAELRINRESTLNRLATLQSAGLLAVAEGADAGYQYRPAKPDLELAVRRLAEVYRERRVAIITFIFSRPLEPVRDFADAFRFKRGDKKDG